MNDNIPVNRLPSNTKIRWWSGEVPSRKLNERRVDILIQDITRTFLAPSAIKPLHADDNYYHYPWGFGGFSGLGF